jgi:hypothetical protein
MLQRDLLTQQCERSKQRKISTTLTTSSLSDKLGI